MKQSMIMVAVVALALFLSSPAKAKTVYDGTGSVEMLMVVPALSVAVEGDVLTLSGVPSVVYFSDRPARLYGHMSTTDLVAFVADNSPQADPPNAALSILGEDTTVVLELVGIPEAKGDSLSWKVRVLEGSLPQEAGQASLFIDAFPTQVNN